MNCDSAVHLVADIFAFIHKDPPTLAAPSEIAPVLEQTIADKRIDRDMTETNEINRKQPETRVLYEADGICSTYITTDTPATFDPPSGEFSFVGCRNGQLRLSTGDGADRLGRNDIVLVGPRNTACRFELDAGAEVNNALTQWQSAQKRAELNGRKVEALQTAVRSTTLLMEHGSTNYLEVLTARQTLLQAQLSELSDKYDEIQAIISLYHALGGGAE